MDPPLNPKTDPDSESYSFVEALWAGAAEVMHVDPESPWDKAVFFAGIKADIIAIDQLLPNDDPPPEVSIMQMLADCDAYFEEVQRGMEESSAALKS